MSRVNSTEEVVDSETAQERSEREFIGSDEDENGNQDFSRPRLPDRTVTASPVEDGPAMSVQQPTEVFKPKNSPLSPQRPHKGAAGRLVKVGSEVFGSSSGSHDKGASPTTEHGDASLNATQNFDFEGISSILNASGNSETNHPMFMGKLFSGSESGGGRGKRLMSVGGGGQFFASVNYGEDDEDDETSAEGQILLSIFAAVDSDGDGFVSYDELQLAIVHLGWSVSSSELAQVVAEIQEAKSSQARGLMRGPSSTSEIKRHYSDAITRSRRSSHGGVLLQPKSMAAVLAMTYNFSFFSKVVESLQNKVRLATFDERPEEGTAHIQTAMMTRCFLPDSPSRWYWSLFVLVWTLYLIFASGFQLIWRDHDDIFQILLAPDMVATLVLAIDCVVNLFTIYIEKREFARVFIDDPKQLVAFRVRTMEFYFDLFAALPIFAIAAAVGPEHAAQRDAGAWLSLIRSFIKMLRLNASFTTTSGKASITSTHVIKYFVVVGPLISFTYLITLIHWSAVFFIYIQEKQGEISYAGGFYFAMYVLSSVGYGDIKMDTQTEKIYVSVLALIGMVVNAVVIGSAIDFVQGGDMTSKQREGMVNLDAVLNFFEIPGALADEIRRFQNYLSFNNLLDTHKNLVRHLPDDITNNLDLFSKIRAITTVPFLSTAPPSVRLGLAHLLRQTSATPETTLLHASLPGESMYFLLYGFVNIYSASGRYLSTIRDGHYMGELSLLTKGNWSRKKRTAAKSLTYCFMFELQKEDFDLLASEFPKFKAQLVLESQTLLAAMKDDEEAEDTAIPQNNKNNNHDAADNDNEEKFEATDRSKLSDILPGLSGFDDDGEVQNYIERSMIFYRGKSKEDLVSNGVSSPAATSPVSTSLGMGSRTASSMSLGGILKKGSNMKSQMSWKDQSESPSPKHQRSPPTKGVSWGRKMSEENDDHDHDAEDQEEEEEGGNNTSKRSHRGGAELQRQGRRGITSVLEASANSATMMPHAARKPKFPSANDLGASFGISSVAEPASRPKRTSLVTILDTDPAADPASPGAAGGAAGGNTFNLHRTNSGLNYSSRSSRSHSVASGGGLFSRTHSSNSFAGFSPSSFPGGFGSAGKHSSMFPMDHSFNSRRSSGVSIGHKFNTNPQGTTLMERSSRKINMHSMQNSRRISRFGRGSGGMGFFGNMARSIKGGSGSPHQGSPLPSLPTEPASNFGRAASPGSPLSPLGDDDGGDESESTIRVLELALKLFTELEHLVPQESDEDDGSARIATNTTTNTYRSEEENEEEEDEDAEAARILENETF